jgi:hypothetical protein
VSEFVGQVDDCHDSTMTERPDACPLIGMIGLRPKCGYDRTVLASVPSRQVRFDLVWQWVVARRCVA